MTSITIQPLATADDLDAVLAIESRSFTNPWTREMYLSELANAGVAFLFLARDGAGDIVGFCSFWRIVDELHINNLAVDPAHRRRGIGSALIAQVLAQARDASASRVILEVRRSNLEARRLYERCGFTVAGVRRNYYTKPDEDALVLWQRSSALDR